MMTWFMEKAASSARRRGAAPAALAAAPEMRRLLVAGGAAAIAFGAACLLAPPAHALSMQECSARYKAAESAGTLGGLKWNDFRKTYCVAGGPTGPAAAPTPAPAPAARQAPATAARSQTAPARAGAAVFPAGVSPKYANEKPARQRMKTCLDQYNANKAANANGGLKWIQKGGGYYSECNRRLKG